eukprot:scaffold2580_cov388-Prasinococcus_capsulatus_cf.AAC.20
MLCEQRAPSHAHMYASGQQAPAAPRDGLRRASRGRGWIIPFRVARRRERRRATGLSVCSRGDRKSPAGLGLPQPPSRPRALPRAAAAAKGRCPPARANERRAGSSQQQQQQQQQQRQQRQRASGRPPTGTYAARRCGRRSPPSTAPQPAAPLSGPTNHPTNKAKQSKAKPSQQDHPPPGADDAQRRSRATTSLAPPPPGAATTTLGGPKPPQTGPPGAPFRRRGGPRRGVRAAVRSWPLWGRGRARARGRGGEGTHPPDCSYCSITPRTRTPALAGSGGVRATPPLYPAAEGPPGGGGRVPKGGLIRAEEDPLQIGPYPDPERAQTPRGSPPPPPPPSYLSARSNLPLRAPARRLPPPPPAISPRLRGGGSLGGASAPPRTGRGGRARGPRGGYLGVQSDRSDARRGTTRDGIARLCTGRASPRRRS